MRNIWAELIIGVAIVAPLAFGADNNFVGTSKYNPGPPPKSLTETVEAAEGGMKVTVTGEGPDGTPINGTFHREIRW